MKYLQGYVTNGNIKQMSGIFRKSKQYSLNKLGLFLTEQYVLVSVPITYRLKQFPLHLHLLIVTPNV